MPGNRVFSHKKHEKIQENIRLAKKYEIKFIPDESDYQFQNKIFNSELYQEELRDQEKKAKIQENARLAIHFNVKYDPIKDKDLQINKRIKKKMLTLKYEAGELAAKLVAYITIAVITGYSTLFSSIANGHSFLSKPRLPNRAGKSL